MSIGQRISELRKSNAFSQEYVAEQLGVTRQAVSKWETDLSAPDTYNLIALAKLFGVSVEYIATGKQADQPQPVTLQAQKHSRIGVQKTVGFILLGTGLLSLILGVLLSGILLLLSVYLIVAGVLCLALRKNAWFAIMWTFLGMTFLLVSILTSQNLFYIFNPAAYQGGLSVGLIISFIFWTWLTAAVAVTVGRLIIKAKKTKKNP